MEKKISVIVPCYNCEEYITRCIESILNQTYTNLEIIIVNDGSTDSTLEKIKPFFKDSRIKYVEQINAGEASARNKGLEVASGELIGYVDSDDYILPEMYQKLYDAIVKEDADMAICNFNLVDEENLEYIKYEYASMKEGVYFLPNNVMEYWMNVCAAVTPNNYAWSRLYKKEVIYSSKIRFEDYIHSSDTLFNFKLLPHLKKCVLVNEGLYNYVQRPSSGIHTVAKKKNLSDLYADTFQSLVDYYVENNYKEFFKVLPIHAYTRLKSVFFYSRLSGISDEKIINNLVESWKGRDIYKYLTGEKR